MADQIEKRLVLTYTSGRLKGISQIVGLAPDQPLEAVPGPFAVENGQVVDFASLIRITPRIVEYREVMPLVKGKLGEFHPEQR